MTLEELVVKITSDTSGLESGFNKIASGAGKIAAGVGKTIAAATAAGATAVATLATSAINSYAEYEQLIGGVETLFKDSAGVVEEYANNAYKTAGLSANEYMETVTSFSASLLQSLDGDTAAAADAANQAITDMADNANKMGTSMESIQNAYQGFAKQNYTMLDNLKLGYGGTKAEMERLLADATALSGIEYDISNLNDVYSAIHVIQEELGITGTTAKEASTTISGSLASMKSAWQNVLTGIADENADFDTLIGNLVETVGTFAENIIPRIEVALKGIGTLIQKLAPIIIEQLPGLVDAILPGLLDAATALVESLIEILPELLPTLLEAIINCFSQILDTILENLPTIVDTVLECITMIIEALAEALPEIITAIVELIPQIIDSISENLPTIVEAIVQGIIQIAQAIIDNLPTMLEAYITLLLSFLDAIIEALPQIIEALPELITGIVEFIIEAIPQLIDAGIQLLTALVEELPTIIEQIVAVLPELINSIISALLENLPLIIQCGIDLLIALVQAMPTIIKTICDALPQIIDSVISALLDNLPAIIECGVTLFVALIENLPTIIVEILKAIPQIIASIVGAIIESVPKIVEAGTELVKGLFQGISNAVEWLYGKLRGWVSDVLSFIKGLFGIASPSKVFAEYGMFLDKGLAEGIVDNTSVATDAMKKMSSSVENAFNPNLEIPEVESDYGLSGMEIAATARVTPAFASSGIELEQESKLQMALQNSNGDIIATLVQVTSQLIETIEENRTIVSIGDDEIAQSAKRGNDNYIRRTGKPIFA